MAQYQKLVFFTLRIALIVSFIMHPCLLSAQSESQFLFEEALQKSKNGFFEEALEGWNQFLNSFPEDPLGWSNRGNVRFVLGDFQGAIADQTKSIEMFPSEMDQVEPHLNRGMAEEALRLWTQAESDYNWILEREPANPYALNNLGNLRVSQGNWTEAEVLFSKASSARQGFLMARSSQALMVYQLGNLENAESELRTIIRKYPMFADSRAALTALLWQKGLFGEAESHWAAVVGLDNRYTDINWLSNVRHWPPTPINDLLAFLALERP